MSASTPQIPTDQQVPPPEGVAWAEATEAKRVALPLGAPSEGLGRSLGLGTTLRRCVSKKDKERSVTGSEVKSVVLGLELTNDTFSC